jgi:Spy/CpxP family protein refolding chaperone
MKNGKLRMNVAAAITTLVLMSTISYAQYGRHEGGRMHYCYGRGYENHSMNPPRYEQLDLTEDQQGKIDEIKLDTSKKLTQSQNKINELEAQLNTTITQDKVDKNKVSALIEEIGKLRTEIRKERMNDHLEIRELLTEKQKVIFDQRRTRIKNVN